MLASDIFPGNIKFNKHLTNNLLLFLVFGFPPDLDRKEQTNREFKVEIT